MPRLSKNERNRALGMVEANVSIRHVARHFRCHPSTKQNQTLGPCAANSDDQRPPPQIRTTERNDKTAGQLYSNAAPEKQVPHCIIDCKTSQRTARLR